MNIYVWNNEWLPNANTVAYYPLTSSSTTSDKSWNSRNMTNSNVSFWTQFWVDCAYISWNADSTHTVSKYLYWNITWLPIWANPRTFSFRIYNDNANNLSNSNELYVYQWVSDTDKMVFISSWWVNEKWYLFISKYWWNNGLFGNSVRKSWCHNVITYDWSKFEWYVNWTSRWTWTISINTASNYINIFGNANSYWNWFNWWMSELILESKARTADEITNYYNSTKSNYWL